MYRECSMFHLTFKINVASKKTKAHHQKRILHQFPNSLIHSTSVQQRTKIILAKLQLPFGMYCTKHVAQWIRGDYMFRIFIGVDNKVDDNDGRWKIGYFVMMHMRICCMLTVECRKSVSISFEASFNLIQYWFSYFI